MTPLRAGLAAASIVLMIGGGLMIERGRFDWPIVFITVAGAVFAGIGQYQRTRFNQAFGTGPHLPEKDEQAQASGSPDTAAALASRGSGKWPSISHILRKRAWVTVPLLISLWLWGCYEAMKLIGLDGAAAVNWTIPVAVTSLIGVFHLGRWLPWIGTGLRVLVGEDD